jgi:hypothetical protein
MTPAHHYTEGKKDRLRWVFVVAVFLSLWADVQQGAATSSQLQNFKTVVILVRYVMLNGLTKMG